MMNAMNNSKILIAISICLYLSISCASRNHQANHEGSSLDKITKNVSPDIAQVSFDEDSLPIFPDDLFLNYKEIKDYEVKYYDSPIEKQIYKILWENPTDGHYILAIYPNHIQLREMHENPNPNSFFWFIYINDDQYKSIKTYIESKKSQRIKGRANSLSFSEPFPHSQLPDKWWGKEDAGKIMRENLYKNFVSLLTELNEKLAEGISKIKIPDGKRIIEKGGISLED